MKAEQKLIDIRDQINAFLNPYARITNAYWENGKIVVEFEANVDIDIRYWYGDKVHEVEDYVSEIDQSEGRFEIGVNQYDKDWNVQVFSEDVKSKPVNVGPFEEEADEGDEPQKTNVKWITDWDSTDGEFPRTVAKVRTREDIDKFDIPVITPGAKADNMLFGFLEDEPYHNDRLTFEEIQRQVDNADFPTGMSFKKSSIKQGKPIPEGLDYLIINFYFFTDYREDLSKEAFLAHLNGILDKAKELTDAKIVLTAQGFWGGHWIKPPNESPLWYLEADVEGVIWWKLDIKDDSWDGINKLPQEFYDNIVRMKDIIQNTPH